MWMSALVEVIRDVFGISNDSDAVAARLREIRDDVGQIRAASATNVDANVRRKWAGALKFCLDLSRLRPFDGSVTDDYFFVRISRRVHSAQPANYPCCSFEMSLIEPWSLEPRSSSTGLGKTTSVSFAPFDREFNRKTGSCCRAEVEDEQIHSDNVVELIGDGHRGLSMDCKT